MRCDRGNRWFINRKHNLALGIWLVCAVGCYGTGNRDGSGETHFLRNCSKGVKCADGLECVCGVCTVRCDEKNICKDQSELASCMPSDCSEQRTCDVECVANEDCTDLGSKYSCENERCRIVDVDPGPIEAESNDSGHVDADGGDLDDVSADSRDSGRTNDSGSDGNNPSSDPCELEDGFYHAVYEPRPDACIPTFYRIPIHFRYSDSEIENSNINQAVLAAWNFDQIDYGLNFSTNIGYDGCELKIIHRIVRDDVLIFELQGTVEIENQTQLSGEVAITEYRADQSVLCQGISGITLMKTGELYDFLTENVTCPPGCRLITAYPITDCVDYTSGLTEAERNVACECDQSDEHGWYSQCHRRLSDNSLWFFSVGELGYPDAWGDCTEEQHRAASISCDFMQCERLLWSSCSRSKMCEVQDCGGLQFDELGCARTSCKNDGDCSDDERCAMLDCPFTGDCSVDRNGDCQCNALLLCDTNGRCNPVSSAGPRGEWQSIEVIQTVVCENPISCDLIWTITPDGQVDLEQLGRTDTAKLSGQDLMTLKQLIDGAQLRVALRDGIECSDPPLDGSGVSVRLVLDGQTLERNISDCILGPEGNVFQQVFDLVTAY